MDQALQLGMNAHKAGNFEEAARLYDSVLATNPTQADALHLRGLVYAKRGDNLSAVRMIGKALQMVPNAAIFHINMAWSLSALAQLSLAKTHAEKALQFDPNLLNARRVLATVLGKLEQLENAADCWTQVLAAVPDDPKAHASLGAIFLELGKIEEATSHLRESLRLNPDNLRAYVPLAEIGSVTLTNDELNKLDVIAKDDQTSSGDRADAYYALGMCHDRAAQFDAAFECFHQGSKLKDASFDVAKHAKYIADTIDVFDEKCFATKLRGSDSDRPVFIVGMPRSGTTLTEQILASHPNMQGVGERGEVRALKNSLQARIGSAFEFPQAAADLNNQQLEEFAQECLDIDRELPASIKRVVNKLPGNFQVLGLIASLFPNARVIHCRRNALDTCLSCFFQNFQHLDYTFDLGNIGEFYVLYRRLMEHWEKVLPLPIFNVNYEEMTNDSEPLIRRMVKFLDVEWDESCLNHQRNKSTVRTASKWQVRQPIHNKSVNRWKNYEKHIGVLIEKLDEFLEG